MFQISDDNRENRKRLKGVRVTVLGAARSGLALARLLSDHGAQVFLSDQRSAGEVEISVTALEKRGIRCEFGGHSPKILEADLMAISPGIPITVPAVQSALQARLPVLGELEMASWFCDSPMIAVTGSNGKTTTTLLMGALLKHRYPELIVGGNIGAPLAEQVRAYPDASVAVVEVSSFQMETIFNFHPRQAVILNLSPNHLDRYADYEAYIRAKMQVIRNLDGEDQLIYNADDPELSRRVQDSPAAKLPFSIRRSVEEGAFWKDGEIHIRLSGRPVRIPVRQPHLRGPHNRYNMTVAALLAFIYGVSPQVIGRELQAFPGVEHRLEPVGQFEGVSYYNDSKATTVASLGYALQSFPEKIVLIAGGKDKGGDFAELNPLLKEHARAAVVIGQAAPKMQQAWNAAVPVYPESSLLQAVKKAAALAQPGDVVVLSPACSSFDMFRDYEDRGRQFKKIVHQLGKSGGTA